MPTILLLLGWRFFCYANEGNEPIHVHWKKGDMECKFWLDIASFGVSLAYAFNMSPRATREIRRIIFQHFDYIVEQWEECQAWYKASFSATPTATGQAFLPGAGALGGRQLPTGGRRSVAQPGLRLGGS
jgi:hypothetical protein